jgi:predicted RNA binding protein YcfA (HicA-like mRNA interferase family)
VTNTTAMKKLLRSLRRRGFTAIQRRSGHVRITHTDAPGRLVVASNSPGDGNAPKSVLRDVRRVFPNCDG